MIQRYWVYQLCLIVFLLLAACAADQSPVPASPLLTSTVKAVLVQTATPVAILSATPRPTSHPTVSASYLTSEAEHQRRLHEESSPTPIPLSTATPTPFYLVMPAPQATNQLIFEGSSVYQETPHFQVIFDSMQWFAVERVLHHQQLTDCTLDLYAMSGETQGPMQETQMRLPNATWTVRSFPAAYLISYYGVTPQQASYLFRVNYGAGADETAIAACRSAAEAVIATFTVLP